MPALYVVATPIGNLEDISLRAIRTLREVALIAAEDTRKTKRLLMAHDIQTPLTSYYEHNKILKLKYLLEKLQTEDIAVVSDAGTPGVSDPGYELVKAAAERGVRVIPIPGASSVIAALAVSGLPTDRFVFLGFLPRKTGERRQALESVAEETGTLIILEAPHRVADTLSDIMQTLGNRKIAVCRELTKIHEEIFRGSVSEAICRFAVPRGEFTLVIEGCHGKPPAEMTADIKERIRQMKQGGARAKESISQLAEESGLAKKELYKVWLEANIPQE